MTANSSTVEIADLAVARSQIFAEADRNEVPGGEAP
jgi:hypothetical protein